MDRSGRTLLIVGVMGVVSVVALMWLAGRYDKVLEEQSSGPVAPALHSAGRSSVATLTPRAGSPEAATPEAQAIGHVDRFLAVRSAMRVVLEALEATQGASPSKRLATLERARDSALAAAGMPADEYREVRTMWRRWRDEGAAPTAAFQAAFVARATSLDAADLGAMEAYD